MAVDFQQIRRQIIELGVQAPDRQQTLRSLREQALKLLQVNASELEAMRSKVQRVVRSYDPNLRCALPVKEPLNARFDLPPLPEKATILAADGSQIEHSRHMEVEYGLINVGAIQMSIGGQGAPSTSVETQLLYDEQLFDLSVATLALRRDLHERKKLADLAQGAVQPVITLTDGQMELWGGGIGDEEKSEFQHDMEEYREVLSQMHSLGITTAGYVDKPAAQLIVRLLEVVMLSESELPQLRTLHPLRGVNDRALFYDLLEPGERSAVFGIQSRFAAEYPEALALHFFYLNVGRPGHPYMARVEIPAWVVENRRMLDDLHAVLVQQCRVMGNRPYPYILHRAHETAVVTVQEREQIDQMIAQELRNRGVVIGEVSYKQSGKSLGGRSSYRKKVR